MEVMLMDVRSRSARFAGNKPTLDPWANQRQGSVLDALGNTRCFGPECLSNFAKRLELGLHLACDIGEVKPLGLVKNEIFKMFQFTFLWAPFQVRLCTCTPCMFSQFLVYFLFNVCEYGSPGVARCLADEVPREGGEFKIWGGGPCR